MAPRFGSPKKHVTIFRTKGGKYDEGHTDDGASLTYYAKIVPLLCTCMIY